MAGSLSGIPGNGFPIRLHAAYNDPAMNVILNGKPRLTADAQNVRALLDELKLSPDRVAVELNRRLLRTDKYDTSLREGDELEIVTFVGGG